MPIHSAKQIRSIVDSMIKLTPHAAAMGIRFDHLNGDKLTLCLPWQESLIGDPSSGAVHDGVLTMLLENTLGIATLCSEKLPPSLNPTLDLRVEHLGITDSSNDIMATAWVHHATTDVITVEGTAWSEAPDQPIARATGSSIILKAFDIDRFLETA